MLNLHSTGDAGIFTTRVSDPSIAFSTDAIDLELDSQLGMDIDFDDDHYSYEAHEKWTGSMLEEDAEV